MSGLKNTDEAWRYLFAGGECEYSAACTNQANTILEFEYGSVAVCFKCEEVYTILQEI